MVLVAAVLEIVSLPLLVPVPVVIVALAPLLRLIDLLPAVPEIDSMPVALAVTAITSSPPPDEMVLLVA